MANERWIYVDNSHYGKCCLCGQHKKLTFEHVPPKSAFNSTKTKIVPGIEALKKPTSQMPWDLSGLHSKEQQRGTGDYYLCGECNSNTGFWYISHYTNFVKCIDEKLRNKNYSFVQPRSLEISFEHIRPLAIFKGIMVLFCDINHHYFNDENLQSYLLNYMETELDTKKYRLFIHIHGGGLQRVAGLSSITFTGGDKIETIFLSEITTYPIGLTLYFDLPDTYHPAGIEITPFAHFPYAHQISTILQLPVLESNVMFPGDYRTKAEIKEQIERNKVNGMG